MSEREVQPGEYGDLLERFRVLAYRLSIDPPPVLIVRSGPTGANGTATRVSISQSILETLPPEEINAILAHELGHVRQQRLQRAFDGSVASENDADAAAVEVTDADTITSALTRIERMTTPELIAQVEEVQRRNNLPPLSQEAINRTRRAQADFIEQRIAYIRSIRPVATGAR